MLHSMRIIISFITSQPVSCFLFRIASLLHHKRRDESCRIAKHCAARREQHEMAGFMGKRNDFPRSASSSLLAVVAPKKPHKFYEF